MAIKDIKKETVIKCPCCGYEYLPAEIYVPSNFFGKPEDIERDFQGKVDIYNGTSMDLTEEYICDNCGNAFEIFADVKFKTKEKKEVKFSPVYYSPIPTKISLFEDM